MGKILTKLFGKKELRVLMLGLDAAGKTSEDLKVFKFNGEKDEKQVLLLLLLKLEIFGKNITGVQEVTKKLIINK